MRLFKLVLKKIRCADIAGFLINFKRAKSSLIIVMIVTLLSSMLAYAYPRLFQQISVALESKDISLIFLLAFVYGMIQLSQISLDLTGTYILRRFDIEAKKEVVDKLYRAILSAPVARIDKYKSQGEIFRRIVDALQLNEILMRVLIGAVTDSLKVAVILSILFFYDPALAVIIVSSIILYTFFSLTMTADFGRLHNSILESQEPLTTMLFDGINKFRTIKALNAKLPFIDSIYGRSINLEKHEISLLARSMKVNFVLQALVLFSLFMVVSYLVYGVITSGLDIGLTIGIMYIVLQVLQPVRNISYRLIDFRKANRIFIRYTEIISLPSEDFEDCAALDDVSTKANASQNRIETIETISLSRVGFTYDGSANAVENIDLTVSKGQRIAIVGRSGAGKTTLMNLMLGFYPPSQGEVLINGIPLVDLNLAEYRKQMGVILQKPEIFSGGLYDNITMGLTEKVKEADVMNVLNQCRLAELVRRFDNDLYRDLSENVVSGGELQRIVLARALIRDPKILFMDEPTSALDNETESLLQDVLANYKRDRIIVTIAHRLSTIADSDMIYVVDKGKLIEAGCHQELFNLGGLYARLYNSSVIP